MGSNIPADVRKYLESEFGSLQESHELMAEYNPEMLKAFASFRRSIFPKKGDRQGALPKYTKEIIATVIEVTLGRGSQPTGTKHARLAIRAGATPEMIHEAMALIFFLGGMTAYVDAGIECVRAARNEASKKKTKRRVA
jgi:alkylhydroperoxidase/carboxymuconolactone decarboxylase family protein YurZ|tara:strand:+ start:680 stop:1096 length:417 start_codon:yes stop_codon:yes gene_type:complete